MLTLMSSIASARDRGVLPTKRPPQSLPYREILVRHRQPDPLQARRSQHPQPRPGHDPANGRLFSVFRQVLVYTGMEILLILI